MKTIFSIGALGLLVLAGNVIAAETETGFVPKNPPEMKPLANRDTPAFRAARLFLPGLHDALFAPAGLNRQPK